MFHSAARDKAMWLKSYKQVGLCYMKMRELQAAIHAFRTALNDQAASPKDIVEVYYYLARSLESVGETGEARDLYRRISQSAPTFRDVARRLKELRQTPKPAGKGRKPIKANDSWFSGVIDNFQRLLTGSQK
jgi:tetratricopeptide (TPR) repeat protein